MIEIVNFFKQYKHLYNYRSFMIQMFSEIEFPKYKVNNNEIDFSDFSQEDKISLLYNSKKIFESLIIEDKASLYYITEINRSSFSIKVKYLTKDKKTALLKISDPLEISQEDTTMKLSSKTTTYGRYILNYLLLEVPLGDISKELEYINSSDFDLKELYQIYRDLNIQKKCTVDQIYEFFKQLDYLSVYADLFAPSLSKALLTPHPEVMKRKKELLSKYKDRLDDISVVTKIEKELIALDKKLLLEDKETAAFASDKTFSNHRKTMFLSMGTVPDPETGKLKFIQSTLDEGYIKEDLPLLFNSVREGISGRATKTAQGGAATKEIVRFLSNTEIIKEDCKTKKTIPFKVTEQNQKSVLYRFIIEDGKTKPIISSDIKKYIGKTIQLRSPMLCQAEGGYCYTCCDAIIEMKKVSVLNVVPVAISSTMMMLEMKKMHEEATPKLDKIKSLDTYIIENINTGGL